jgi:hypothetical protein
LPVLDQDGSCRAYTQNDCTATKPVLQSGSTGCRERTAQDCTATNPFFDNKVTPFICRGWKASDCSTTKPIFVSNTQGCRVRQQQDCTGNTPILGDDNECRGIITSDCGVNQYAEKPVFNAATKTCESSIKCDLAQELSHPGGPGNCPANGLEGGASCLPTCDSSLDLVSSGGIKCSSTGIIENTFICSLKFELSMSGITKENFEADPKLETTFKQTVSEVTGASVDSIKEINVGDPLEGSLSSCTITMKINIVNGGESAKAITTAVKTAVTDGSFDSKYRENLQSSAVTSVEVGKIKADAIQSVAPPSPSGSDPNAGPNDQNDTGDSKNSNGGGGGSGGPIVAVVVVLLVAIGIAYWYFKIRKPAEKKGMNKLESPTDVMNPAQLDNMELQGPAQDANGGPVITTNNQKQVK